MPVSWPATPIPYSKHVEVPMQRHKFIVKAGGVLATATVGTRIVDASNVIAQQEFQRRMSKTGTPALDVLHGAAQTLGRLVDEMSGGQLRTRCLPVAS